MEEAHALVVGAGAVGDEIEAALVDLVELGMIGAVLDNRSAHSAAEILDGDLGDFSDDAADAFVDVRTGRVSR